MNTKDEPALTPPGQSRPGGVTAPFLDEDAVALAERVRAAVIRAALAAFEDAGLQGLCCEGAWELALSAMRAADLRQVATTFEAPKE